MNTLNGVFAVALMLLIWFKTEAFIEYCNLRPFSFLRRIFKIDEYHKVKTTDYSYHEFLLEWFNNFFTRLITCPICLSVWLGMFVSAFTGFSNYPVVTFLGLFSYLLIAKIL